MKTSIKWKEVARLNDADKVKTLASAIAFEFAKPQLCVEMAEKAAIAANGNVVGFARNDPAFDRFKSFVSSKYATPSDNPQLVDVANQLETFFHTNMPEMDMAWSLLFDLIDLRSSTHDHFDILDTNAGISFNQTRPGEEVKIRRNITENKTTVSYLAFADGLGLLDDWLRFNQFWNIDEAIAEFRAKYYDKMAATHYGLLTALSTGVNEAFALDDVQTANNAAAAILRNVYSKGYGVGSNARFYAVCAVEKVGRLQKMLTAQLGSAIVSQGAVSQPLTVGIDAIIGTTHIPASDTGWYLVLPRRKIKRAVWQDLTVESNRNIYVSATDLVGQGKYNAAIGDSAQIRRCLYA